MITVTESILCIFQMKMWEGKRSLNLRRHSDSSLPGYRKRLDSNLCSFNDNRIPPLHDLPTCGGDNGEEDFDDEWFAKLVGSNEPLSSPSLNDGNVPFRMHDFPHSIFNRSKTVS